MADLSITASEVLYVSGKKGMRQCGEALATGDVVYLKSADSKVWKADADAEASAEALGIVLGATNAADQWCVVQEDGTITIGSSASVAQGQSYVVSGTAGKIAVEGDLTTGDYVTHLGVGNASDQIVLGIKASAIDHV